MDKFLYLWIVKFDGSYLGGTAIVMAGSAEEAIYLTRNHPVACNVENAEAEKIEVDLDKPGAIFIYNGDY